MYSFLFDPNIFTYLIKYKLFIIIFRLDAEFLECQ